MLRGVEEHDRGSSNLIVQGHSARPHIVAKYTSTIRGMSQITILPALWEKRFQYLPIQTGSSISLFDVFDPVQRKRNRHFDVLAIKLILPDLLQALVILRHPQN